MIEFLLMKSAWEVVRANWFDEHTCKQRNKGMIRRGAHEHESRENEE